MNNVFFRGFLITMVLCTIVNASAIYDKAVAFYKAGQYDSTISVVRGFLKTNGKDSESEKLVPLVSEALVRTGDYSSVQRLFSMFHQKYPNSSLMPRMWYLKGMADAKLKNYSDAVRDFSAALEGGVNATLESQVISNVELLCQNISAEELEALHDGSGVAHAKIQEVVQYYEIAKLYAIGQFGKAQALSDAFVAKRPRSKYVSSIRDLAVRAKDQEKSSIQLGLLAPLSGDAADVGKRVVNGAQLAFEQFSSSSGKLIKPVIFDTKGSMMENARRTKELIDVHKVPVILGPVLSQDAIVSASMVMGKNTVMLTPTATEDGIAELGNNIFQMNVSIASLGRKIAEYAMNNLNMKEFAILAPQNEYGITMANSFKDELKKKNIKVVAEQYFEEGGNDFSVQFGHLRNALLLKRFERVSAERGVVFKGKVTRADSVRFADTTLSVGGLFIPAEADDIVMIAPQVAFNRIHTQILGSNGWQSQKVLKDGSTYVQGAMISATVEPDQSTPLWMDFKKAFKARFNYEPDRITALGYDAANLIIKAVQDAGVDNPSRFAEALMKVHGYQGLSGAISFDQSKFGNNTESAIMKITPNGFIRVQ